MKRNCHNFRTNDHIDIKLGPVSKLDKKNKTTSKKLDNHIMSENCGAIVIFLIYGQFGAIRNLDSGRIVCNAYIFTNSNLLYYKTWNQN